MKFTPFTKFSKITSLLLLCTLCATSLSAKDEAKEEDNSPLIVCFGDSITKRGYGDIIAKSLDIRSISAGVGGNNTAQGLRRMDKDVLDHDPDIVIIFFGTNDLRVDSHKHIKFKDYKKNLHEMIKRSRRAGAKALLCTCLLYTSPSPRDKRQSRMPSSA